MNMTNLLTVAFVVLKLMGVITWSWVWVLAPTWIDLLLTILVTVIGELKFKEL